jgi:hypothetical protein
VTIKANLYNAASFWEHISAVEYFLDKEKVTGSIPVAPTKVILCSFIALAAFVESITAQVFRNIEQKKGACNFHV